MPDLPVIAGTGTLLTVEHDPAACYGSVCHCFWHNVDEPGDPYRVCFECRHAFMSAAELLAGHNRILADLNKDVDPAGDPLWVSTTPIPPETDVTQVFCCPLCAHDW